MASSESTERTTLSEYESAGRADGTMDKILNMDDAVEELTPIQVKDVWVRGALMKQVMDATRPLPGREPDPVEHFEKKLKSGSPAVYKELAIAELSDDLADRLGWSEGAGNVEVMWDALTDDTPEEEKLRTAREKVKTALRGCGMARITVQREAVKYHHNNPYELTATDAAE